MARATSGNNAQFTYDFGIAIAQSTVNKITKLTGVTISLASAYYALKTSASQYIDTLRDNVLRFEGVLSTMKAMEQAQDRLIKGLSYFSVDDQLRGMNQLMAVGIDVGENLEWVNKAAHATGKSYAEFSGMIASAIQGNSQALVDAGLMTQRATRMFDKYEANTIMRQQAILNFVKSHKGLMNAVENDFETVQDQVVRLKSSWQSFLKAVVGKPNDPSGFYGQITSALKSVASAFGKNAELMQRYGYMIGQTLGWVVKQIGHVVVWAGRQVKKALQIVWKVTENFQEQSRSLIVWLEFWKVKIIDFFKKYSHEIKIALQLLIAYKALKYVFVIGGAAIKSVKMYRNALLGTFALQKRYMSSMGPFVGRTAKFFQSLAVWLPKPFRRAWVAMGKFFADFAYNMKLFGRALLKVFKAPFKFIWGAIKFTFRLIKNIPTLIGAIFRAIKTMWNALNATNPIGWIILAITLLTTLYVKSEKFRVFMNNLFKAIWEGIKLIWNSLAYVITYAQIGCKLIWGWFREHIWDPVAEFFRNTWSWIDNMWSKFKDTSVGKWIDKWIVQPLKTVFEWIVKAWNWVVDGIGNVIKWFSKGNDKVSEATQKAAEKYGVKPIAPTFSGGTYDTNDTTNYLSPDNWRKRNSDSAPIDDGTYNSNAITDHLKDKGSVRDNPLLATSSPMVGASSGSVSSTNMTFDSGAIQIIVQKGEMVDEDILARKVKRVISDLKRDGDMRSGVA